MAWYNFLSNYNTNLHQIYYKFIYYVYLITVQGVLLVFDVTDKRTFDQLIDIKAQVRKSQILTMTFQYLIEL